MFRMARQPDCFAPGLKRCDRHPHVIVNAATKPAEAGYRMWSLPCLMQHGGDLNAISRYKPGPRERLTASGQNRCNKRDMTISAGSERKIARHDQSE